MKRWIALLLALIVALGAVMAAGRMYVLWQGTPEGDETAQDEFENWPVQGDAEPDADYLDLLLDEETKNVLVQDEFRYQVADGDYSITEGLDEDVMNI